MMFSYNSEGKAHCFLILNYETKDYSIMISSNYMFRLSIKSYKFFAFDTKIEKTKVKSINKDLFYYAKSII